MAASIVVDLRQVAFQSSQRLGASRVLGHRPDQEGSNGHTRRASFCQISSSCGSILGQTWSFLVSSLAHLHTGRSNSVDDPALRIHLRQALHFALRSVNPESLFTKADTASLGDSLGAHLSTHLSNRRQADLRGARLRSVLRISQLIGGLQQLALTLKAHSRQLRSERARRGIHVDRPD
jgi:hypothetical protein